MKHSAKPKYLMVMSLLALLAFSSCVKESDNSSILFNDPQDIPFITDYLPTDLLEMFGEEHVFFGDQPPVVDMEFVSNHEYVATSLQPPYAPPVGTVTPIRHFHKIVQQYLQIADYYSMSSEESRCHLMSPVYMTGHDKGFTAYYFEEPDTDGKPVHACMFSGKVTNTGIQDFRYGYKIVRYNDSIVPPTVYPVNSIFVFKDYDGMADKETWFNDSLVEPQN